MHKSKPEMKEAEKLKALRSVMYCIGRTERDRKREK